MQSHLFGGIEKWHCITCFVISGFFISESFLLKTVSKRDCSVAVYLAENKLENCPFNIYFYSFGRVLCSVRTVETFHVAS